MVKLTEVEDEHFSEKPVGTNGEVLLGDDDDYTDTDSEISDDDLATSSPSHYSEPNETLSDRIYALRDIVPPRTRAQIASTTSSLYSLTGSAITYGGKGLWILATSAFLLGIPYALALGQEQEIVEEEKRQGMMTEGASGLLQPQQAGGEAGSGEVRQSL